MYNQLLAIVKKMQATKARYYIIEKSIYLIYFYLYIHIIAAATSIRLAQKINNNNITMQ